MTASRYVGNPDEPDQTLTGWTLTHCVSYTLLLFDDQILVWSLLKKRHKIRSLIKN
jgi:hypothetical protein